MRGREIELERERECVYVNEKEGRERVVVVGKAWMRCAGEERKETRAGWRKGEEGVMGMHTCEMRRSPRGLR